MITMTFDEFDSITEKVEQLPEELEMQDNFSMADLEKLFITFPNPDKDTGHAPDVIAFLLYLQSKIDEDETEQFKETSKNIDAVLRKYLVLED